MKSILACLSFVVWLTLASISASAATVNGSGVIGLSVGGTVYNVSFQDGTCTELFDGCDEQSDFPFARGQQADDAAEALHSAILGSAFANTPMAFVGCEVSDFCTILTFTRPKSSDVNLTAFGVDITQMGSSFSGEFCNCFTEDFALTDEVTIATWEIASVPLPAASWMLIAGVGGLLGFGSMRRKV